MSVLQDKSHYRKLSMAALDYNIKDLREVIEVQERGPANLFPKLGQYYDELFEYSTEKKRRTTKPKVCELCGATK